MSGIIYDISLKQIAQLQSTTVIELSLPFSTINCLSKNISQDNCEGILQVYFIYL
ncbi:hypothetical protein TTHERM_000414208 (macronuclear) [Tetrahymena thermophila SB210]|uniref:Uncharacterized protein n=1 Tax=Tetrahymena thermophila (strain SB210) TaxID=312017 RepID=W7XLN5_TETTS|nr:hypothetical protein TTHERM_000414208 [Tetrahymena thermophila SB210]EWS76599.1 hypothetical protein TTHERM_000414208 [Tetrahymena thermophila SB210]|eukprot:XP_012650885.1 hypothetical protein TTHERM_000414208 [Tetrahymena thermophila SB210]